MSRRWVHIAVTSVAAITLVVHALYFRSLFGGYSVDDAYISYRYATHFARGDGLVFNQGERVEGYSNFLWTVLLAPLARQFDDLTLPSQLMGLAASVGALVTAACALRWLGIAHLAATAFLGFFIASSGYVAAWSMAGLEGPLFGFLLLAAWARWTREQRGLHAPRPVSALLVGALALTRPEGVFVALGAALLHVVVRRQREASWLSRRIWVFPVMVLAGLLIYELWRWNYYGLHMFPNSVQAKIGGGTAQLMRGLDHLRIQFLLPYASLLVVPVLLVRGPWTLELATGFALLLAYLLFFAAAGGDWSAGRFYAPVLPLGGVVLTAAFMHSAWVRSLRPSGAARLLLAVALVAYLAWSFLVTSVQREQAMRRKFALVDAERVAIGRWLAREVPQNAKLAVYAAGQIPYYSHLYTHDMLGLNDTHIASLKMARMGHGSPGHEKYDAAYTLEHVRPDIIVSPTLIPGVREHPLFLREYVEIRGFWRFADIVMRREFLRRLGREPQAGP